jgi:hypothetical protein
MLMGRLDFNKNEILRTSDFKKPKMKTLTLDKNLTDKKDE